LVEYALAVAHAKPSPDAPLHVEVIRRGASVFVVNHNDRPEKVRLGISGKALVGTYARGVATLPPYGVCVVQGKKSD
jgi:hypothetical protein